SATSALTISGWPAAPRSERTTRPSGAEIRFTSPATTALATAYLVWRRNVGGCTLSLRNDDEGAPGAPLAVASVAPGSGWRATPLVAPLVAGQSYHLVARCDPDSPARLTYVLDADPQAVTARVWEGEDL